MSERSLTHEKLLQIAEALRRIDRRFADIDSPDDFLDSERGVDMLDGIGMMLIAIGENLKGIDRETDEALLQ